MKICQIYLKIGGRDHFSRVVVPRMADDVREKIKNKVGSFFYALTSDGWSQPTLTPSLQRLNIYKAM